MDTSRYQSVLKQIATGGHPGPCGYFPQRESCVYGFYWNEDLPADFLDFLLNDGYRRCGAFYYKMKCAACRQCISYRLKMASFRPSRSQRRVFRRGQHLHFSVSRPRLTPEKEEIYQDYLACQHADTPLTGAHDPLEVMHLQMYEHIFSSTAEFELRTPDSDLVAFGILDLGKECASAVYNVFNPRYARNSPGVLAILYTLAWIQAHGFAYCHLGYYIPGHPKMMYKIRYGPGEYLHEDSCWQSVCPKT